MALNSSVPSVNFKCAAAFNCASLETEKQTFMCALRGAGTFYGSTWHQNTIHYSERNKYHHSIFDYSKFLV